VATSRHSAATADGPASMAWRTVTPAWITWSVPAICDGERRRTAPSASIATTVGTSTVRPGSRLNIG
jgi:hypothetical protein